MHGAVNRAIAVAEGDGAEAGLALADRLDWTATSTPPRRGRTCSRRLGRAEEARTEYERALELAHTESERRFLKGRLARVSAYSPIGTGKCPRTGAPFVVLATRIGSRTKNGGTRC